MATFSCAHRAGVLPPGCACVTVCVCVCVWLHSSLESALFLSNILATLNSVPKRARDWIATLVGAGGCLANLRRWRYCHMHSCKSAATSKVPNLAMHPCSTMRVTPTGDCPSDETLKDQWLTFCWTCWGACEPGWEGARDRATATACHQPCRLHHQQH
jgi:hypothetical protein